MPPKVVFKNSTRASVLSWMPKEFKEALKKEGPAISASSRPSLFARKLERGGPGSELLTNNEINKQRTGGAQINVRARDRLVKPSRRKEAAEQAEQTDERWEKILTTKPNSNSPHIKHKSSPRKNPLKRVPSPPDSESDEDDKMAHLSRKKRK
eukprot:TRINITY_DN66591_c4_g8_i1.p2 TRINITY_DN66591_c4_g8~~TRINITY_DN66591_c4_g8_i1.p2  ORF type:complete len:153 (-),score=8.96 TRINITY_DN66591_c4_g8_i1:246-704(-)